MPKPAIPAKEYTFDIGVLPNEPTGRTSLLEALPADLQTPGTYPINIASRGRALGTATIKVGPEGHAEVSLEMEFEERQADLAAAFAKVAYSAHSSLAYLLTSSGGCLKFDGIGSRNLGPPLLKKGSFSFSGGAYPLKSATFETRAYRNGSGKKGPYAEAKLSLEMELGEVSSGDWLAKNLAPVLNAVVSPYCRIVQSE
ncbi:MAG: hypothetical protein V1820_00135 [archaeon]